MPNSKAEQLILSVGSSVCALEHYQLLAVAKVVAAPMDINMSCAKVARTACPRCLVGERFLMRLCKPRGQAVRATFIVFRYASLHRFRHAE
jgi:hypothetical protein